MRLRKKSAISEFPSLSARFDPQVVSTETGMYLHRLMWVDDSKIGSLPLKYTIGCKVIILTKMMQKQFIFTNGSPWYEHMKNMEYSDE